MTEELCPNCESPFSDILMMGFGANQPSPKFQCGSIFVPVAKRLVVKTYACMKIAELRASIAKPAAVPEAVAKDALMSEPHRTRALVAMQQVYEAAQCVTVYTLADMLDAALLSAADTEVKNG